MAKYTPLGQRGQSKSGDSGKSSGDLKPKLTANNAGSNSTSSGAPTPNPYAGSSTQSGNMGNYQKGKTPGTTAPMPQNIPSSGDLGKSSGDLQQYKPPQSGNTASGAPTTNPYSGSSTQPGDMDSYQKDQDLSSAQRMQPKRPVYDDQDGSNGSFDPSLYNNSGTNTASGTPTANPYSQTSTQPDTSDSYSKKPIDSTGLGDREKAAASGAVGAVGKAEKGLIGGGLNKADKFLPPQAKVALATKNLVGKLFGSKRKKASSGIAGLVAGLLIFGFSIGIGPLKLIHLSQILQKGFVSSDQDSGKGMKGLLRYARSGNVGETRVGLLGHKLLERANAKLAANGIKVSKTNPITNGIRQYEIDTRTHQATKGRPPGLHRQALLDFYTKNGTPLLSDGMLKQTSQLSYTIDVDPTTKTGAAILDGIVEKNLGTLQNGKIQTAINMRLTRIYYFQKRLFSPVMNYFRPKAEGAADTAVARKTAKEERRAAQRAAAQERLQALRGSPIGVAAANGKSKLKTALDPHRFKIGVTLGVTATACLARLIIDVGPKVDQADAIFAATEAADATAFGSGVQLGSFKGQKINAEGVGAKHEALTAEDGPDKGKDVFGGKAMQALSGKPLPRGPDLPNNQKQIFSVNNQSDIAALADTVGDNACGTEGTLIQIGLGGLLLATGPGGWLVGAGVVAGSAATSIAIGIALNKYEDDAANKFEFELPFSGPLGGNQYAYGARYLGGASSISMGGSAKSKEESDAMDKRGMLESQEEFRSRGFAARLFDIYDHRSVAGNLIDSSTGDPGQNISNVASSLTNFGSTILATFTPKAYAQEAEPYDWGFPHYGIPSKLFDDPAYQNPYENADKAAVFLNTNPDYYKEHAKTCYGVKIDKDSEGRWESIPEVPVNPKDANYLKANCNDTSDEGWNRITLLVFYDRMVVIDTCYDGELTASETIEACKELGAADGTAASATPGSADPGAPVSGDAKELAQQILDNNKINKAGRYVTEDLTNMASGNPAYGSVNIDANILKFLADLGQTTPYTITSITGAGCGHSHDTCKSAGGSSNHYEGKAVDLGCGFNEAKADQIAKKYGLLADNERCDDDIDHSHFSSDGF